MVLLVRKFGRMTSPPFVKLNRDTDERADETLGYFHPYELCYGRTRYKTGMSEYFIALASGSLTTYYEYKYIGST